MLRVAIQARKHLCKPCSTLVCIDELPADRQQAPTMYFTETSKQVVNQRWQSIHRTTVQREREVQHTRRGSAKNILLQPVPTFFSMNFWASKSPSANPVMEVRDLARMGCDSSRLLYATQKMPNPAAFFLSPSPSADADAPSGGTLPSPPPFTPPPLDPLFSVEAEKKGRTSGADRRHGHKSQVVGSVEAWYTSFDCMNDFRSV